jgi:hypothetical protein
MVAQCTVGHRRHARRNPFGCATCPTVPHCVSAAQFRQTVETLVPCLQARLVGKGSDSRGDQRLRVHMQHPELGTSVSLLRCEAVGGCWVARNAACNQCRSCWLLASARPPNPLRWRQLLQPRCCVLLNYEYSSRTAVSCGYDTLVTRYHTCNPTSHTHTRHTQPVSRQSRQLPPHHHITTSPQPCVHGGHDWNAGMTHTLLMQRAEHTSARMARVSSCAHAHRRTTDHRHHHED